MIGLQCKKISNLNSNYWGAVDDSNIKNHIDFFKKEIVRMKVSSISFAINGNGYEYSTSSLYC